MQEERKDEVEGKEFEEPNTAQREQDDDEVEAHKFAEKFAEGPGKFAEGPGKFAE
jgi:hypothetical protein